MAQELRPCGTLAAARRHRRKGEDLCDDCVEAERVQKLERDESKRSESALAVAGAVNRGDRELDVLEEAWDSLELVRAALHSGAAPPHTIAQLTKRRDELVDRIRTIENERPSEVSVIDELTSRRKRRTEATG